MKIKKLILILPPYWLLDIFNKFLIKYILQAVFNIHQLTIRFNLLKIWIAVNVYRNF